MKNKKSITLIAIIISLIIALSSISSFGVFAQEDENVEKQEESSQQSDENSEEQEDSKQQSEEDAERLEELRRQAEELEKKIDEANKKLDDLSGDKDKQKQYINQLNAQIGDLQKQINVLDSSINVLDNQISNINTKISEKNDNISDLNEKIIEAEENIADCEKEIEDTYEQLKKRLRAIYMNGEASLWEVLLCSDDISTFLMRSELVSSIAKHDTQLMDKLKEQISSLENKKAELIDDKEEMALVKDQLQSEIDELAKKENEMLSSKNKIASTRSNVDSKLKTSMSYLNELDKESKEYKDLIKKYESDMAEFEEQINRILSDEGSSGSGAIAEGEMIWPVPYNNTYITSAYGYRNDPISGKWSGHGGTDISMPGGSMGKKIVAAMSGKVIVSTYHSSYGNYVLIDHGNGLSTLYAHCSAVHVSKGQTVTQGEHIANIGSTGYSTGPHLHFEVRVNGTRQDPMNFVSIPN